MEIEDEDDMGLQLALKKARKLKQLETIERKPDLADVLVVSHCLFLFLNKLCTSIHMIKLVNTQNLLMKN